MRKILAGLLFACFISSAALAGGYVDTEIVASKVLTIKTILGSPDYLNTAVEIQGTYKGGYSKIGAPPKTRSDYILEDTTGQIYVSGPLPQGVSMKDIGKNITVKGIVKTSKSKAIYLEVR
ncbi:MAG: hypothetical protein NT099_09035 [Candidatus Saganbacteria bacterium]|nr:hypothetical protein [Candidatus Saganbacteria bacterium]